ncbi:MAG: hypothetical protein ABIJ28_03525 [Patescibacteria group bacterium]
MESKKISGYVLISFLLALIIALKTPFLFINSNEVLDVFYDFKFIKLLLIHPLVSLIPFCLLALFLKLSNLNLKKQEKKVEKFLFKTSVTIGVICFAIQILFFVLVLASSVGG